MLCSSPLSFWSLPFAGYGRGRRGWKRNEEAEECKSRCVVPWMASMLMQCFFVKGDHVLGGLEFCKQQTAIGVKLATVGLGFAEGFS
jgi:hypothetical protein